MKPLKITRAMDWATRGNSERTGNDFIGIPYEINNPDGITLQPGDKCLCHPTIWSNTMKTYEVYIVQTKKTLKTMVPGEHTREVDDYIFPRLEFIKRP